MKKFLLKSEAALASKRGEASVGTAIAILTAVVVGAALMIGVYALMKNVVLTKTTSQVESLFAYSA